MKEENIINFDFQGWPEYKMTLKDILEQLGVYDYKIKNEALLDACPALVTDDGMGYGVDEQYIIEVSACDDKIFMFRDKPLEGVEKFVELQTCPGDVIDYNGKEYSVSFMNDDGNFVLYEFDIDKLIDKKGEKITVTPDELKEILKNR